MVLLGRERQANRTKGEPEFVYGNGNTQLANAKKASIFPPLQRKISRLAWSDPL